jgi:hypothetical protein
MAMAARMPMIATTIISSIRVKPFWVCFNIFRLLESGLQISGKCRHPADEQGTCQALSGEYKLLFDVRIDCD